MLPYWILFAVLALAAIVERPPSGDVPRPGVFLAMAGLLLAVFIGLRFQVGGDWLSYEQAFQRAGYQSLGDTLARPDPGYEALNWLGQLLGLGVWFVNLVCGAVFVWGLLRLARTQPRPWMVVFLSMPYLITVVAMGYTRQAVAIGIVMASFACVIRGGGPIRAVAYIALATLFHRTALIALPLVPLATSQRRLWVALAIIPALYGLYVTLVAPTVGHLTDVYIDERYSSAGAAVRVALVVLGAAVFLVFRNRLGFAGAEARLWFYLSVAAAGCAALLLLLASSVVVDRLALYIIPLQVVVFARIPTGLVSDGVGKAALTAYAAAVLFVWLNSGVNAAGWIPYRNYIAELYMDAA